MARLNHPNSSTSPESTQLRGLYNKTKTITKTFKTYITVKSEVTYNHYRPIQSSDVLGGEPPCQVNNVDI